VTSFDELIGAEPEGPERERLRSAHELILEAGPPPELTPELESGPTLAMTLGRARRLARNRRRMLIPAIAAAFLVALVVGIATNHHEGKGIVVIPLKGTPHAPQAHGTLDVFEATNDHQPMRIEVQGLEPGEYAVYLVHNGRSWEECGTFFVADVGGGRPKNIDSPYRARAHDTWVVTRVTATGHGVTVLTPATT
jgi:hypothetical protein